MRMKMTQPGYESFTGTFGNTVFTDGISNDVPEAIATALSALIQCEPVRDSAPVTRASQRIAGQKPVEPS